MRLDVVSIFPDYLAPLELSLIGKARRQGLITLAVHDLRDFAHDRHRTVDATPYGGGAGMVMKPQPWSEALAHVGGLAPGTPRLLVPAPSGQPFSQALARELAQQEWLAFACGRYEGIDERVYEHAALDLGWEVLPVSLGDYVLNGGEVAVLAMTEAIVRLIPGVVGNEESLVEESHEGGLLEYPVYTKPARWEVAGGVREVPAVLLSGNHADIAAWRHQQRLERTAARRPDLLAPAAANAEGLAGLSASVATPADAGEVLTLILACSGAAPAGAPSFAANEPADVVRVAQEDASWRTWLWRSADRLVAAVSVRLDPDDPQTWQIERLLVAPDLSGRGLEAAVLAYAEALAPAQAHTLLLGTLAPRDRGHREADLIRYRRAGYRPLPRAGDPAGPVHLSKRVRTVSRASTS